MKGTSAALKAHMALGTTTMALCWKATLTNGTVVTATAHDRDIVFGGLTYLSTAAYTPSDVESGADMAPDNLELEGFLASPHITATDVHTGIWDYAAIEIFEVNYKDLTMGRNRIREGTLGEVKAGLAMFRAEMRGLMQAYSRKIVRLIQAICDADFGDARCGINAVTYTTSTYVDTVTSDREFTLPVSTHPDDYYTGGKVTFTSGLNDGLSMEVKSSVDSTRVIQLHEFMPFAIAPGDTFDIVAGCLKRRTEDCGTKYSNVVNFRGYPDLPGSRVYAGPTR